MCFWDAHTSENSRSKACCERIASTNSISDINLWRLLKRLDIRCKDVRSIHTTSQYEHIKVILAQQKPAFILYIKTWIAKKTTNGDELLIVNFENISMVERVSDNLLRIEVLAKIDIKDL